MAPTPKENEFKNRPKHEKYHCKYNWLTQFTIPLGIYISKYAIEYFLPEFALNFNTAQNKNDC